MTNWHSETHGTFNAGRNKAKRCVRANHAAFKGVKGGWKKAVRTLGI